MPDGSTDIAKVADRQQRSVLVTVASRYGMEPAAFETTLRNTVVPGNTTREQFAAFLLVAQEYRLNPLTKELFAFPAKGGGIVPIVSVDGWARIINDHPAFDGMEFHDQLDPKTGELMAITCRMYRKDRARPTETTEYMVECRRGTDVWRQWPRRMLRHKAMIQCARMAFGFAGIYDEDEYQRMVEAPAPAREVRQLHAGFDDPAPAAEAQPSQEAVDAEFTAGPPPSTTGGEGLEVVAWGHWLMGAVEAYPGVDELRAVWDGRKDELKAADPALWRVVNQAVAERALEIGSAS